jgi:anti-sigma factor RsiW
MKAGGTMLRCNKQKLSAYVDGELSVTERRRIQSHVRRCRDCAQELKRLREAIKALPAAKEMNLPAAKRKALHRAISR